MSIRTIEKLTWVLIYGGLLVLCFGLAVQRRDSGIGMGMAGVGAVAAAVGFVLIYVRSRMRQDK